METVTNIRTVASFGHENTLSKFYSKKLEKPESLLIPKGLKGGFSFGFSNFIMYVMYAVTFYAGA